MALSKTEEVAVPARNSDHDALLAVVRDLVVMTGQIAAALPNAGNYAMRTQEMARRLETLMPQSPAPEPAKE